MDKKKSVNYINKKVCYIFRSKNLKQFSIENVFKYIKGSLSDDFKIDEAFVPYGRIKTKEIFANLLFAKKIEADIFHITGDVHYIAAVLPRRNTVLTIHDLVGFYNYNNSFKKLMYYFFWFFIPSIKCKYITVISEKTKKDFLRVCPWAKKRTFVIPDPINPSFKYSRKEFNTDKPLILLMGTSKNKNHMRIIEALNGFNCELAIVGKMPIEEIELLKERGISYTNHYNVEEEQIRKLYIESDIVLFPSTYEGFGMPIIEAQKVGRCVITSNIEPMSEVAGKGACLVDPYDVDDIREKLDRVVNDPQFRNRIIKFGLENVEKYAPYKVAQEFEIIYKKIKRPIVKLNATS